MFDDETYDQVEVELIQGDRLMLYTDGFEQAFPNDPAEGDGEGRLRKPTRRYREEFLKLGLVGTPGDMIEAICRRLDQQSGSLHQIDDLTLLCLHAGPLAQVQHAPDEEKIAA